MVWHASRLVMEKSACRGTQEAGSVSLNINVVLSEGQLRTSSVANEAFRIA